MPTTCALLLETKDSFVSLVKKIVFVTSEYRFLFYVDVVAVVSKVSQYRMSSQPHLIMLSKMLNHDIADAEIDVASMYLH